MGNQENKSNALQCDSTATLVPVDNEAHLDPLRTFIKNSSSFSVKTFTDVERLSELQAHKSRSTIINSIHNTNHLPQKTGKQDEASCVVLGQLDANITARTSLKQSSRRSNSIENNFKTIAISQQTFIKMKQQDPLQHYEMKEKIGQGNFGEVFRAVLKQSGQERAIKVLKVKLMREENKKQFFAEMSLLSKLNHPSIITLYQLFHYNQKYYVVMEYCRGGTIIEALKRLRNKSEDVIAKIMRQLLSALSYMHSLHIIHRDIKLDNIVLLSRADDCITIKIIDFGTAVQTKHKLVQNYSVAGTLSYLAPEVLSGTLTEKSDIWSSGVLMYILLTGSTPFRGKNESETKMNILKKNIDYDSPQFAEVSQQAKDLLRLMLTRSIADRIPAFDALHHSWLDLSIRSKTASLNNIDLLANYCRNNNFVAMIESYLSLKKITQQERQKLAQIFTSIDSDGNGQIERDELLSLFKKKLWKASEYSEQQLLQIVSSIDINNSGKIDFNEFIIAMYDKRKVYMRESLSEAFEYFDMDHTGYIEIQELREMLKGGDNAEIDYFLHQLDTDSDNKISKDEFIDYLLNY